MYKNNVTLRIHFMSLMLHKFNGNRKLLGITLLRTSELLRVLRRPSQISKILEFQPLNFQFDAIDPSVNFCH
jgi:hypothetical protein